MNQEKEIGEVFRESFSGYTQEPPAGLWDAIAQDKTLLRFNRRKRMARIAKFVAVPAIATVAIVTALLLSNGKSDSPLAVATDSVTAPVTEVPSEAVPSPAPISAVESTQPVAHTPQNTPTPKIIAVSQDTDNQQVTIAETTVSEPTATVAENTERAEVAEAVTPKQKVSTNVKERPREVVKTPTVPTDIQPAPKAGRSGQLAFSKDTSVCRNSQVTLFVRNATDVRWNVGMTGESITLCPDEPVLISATFTTNNKIDTTIYIHVGVFDCGLWIPTAFTPNSDGLNDEFIVHAPAGITHYECAIYDRSRGLLFRTNNILQGWDGTANGKPLPLGAYFYIITYRDEAGVKHVEKGQITLIR